MQIYTYIKRILFSPRLLLAWIRFRANKLYKSCREWLVNNREDFRAYLANQEPVTSNLNSSKPKNPVVSELAEPEIFVKFLLVEKGIKIESSLGEGKDEDASKITRLLYQVTTEKQNSNIIKHFQLSGISQSLINKITDTWQMFKIVDNQTNEIEKTKKKIVVRASQVLNSQKD